MNQYGPGFAVILLAALGVIAPANAEERSTMPDTVTGDQSGADDFDFLFGEWRVHHRIKRPVDTGQRSEFEGTVSNRGLIDGSANVEEHSFDRPTGVTHGIAIRAYDAKSAEWAIWWIDSRVPHNPMDPPMKGRFENGVGTFYSDSTLDGKPIKVRFIWSGSETGTPRWEQAYSDDGGKTWAANWIMEFRPADDAPKS